MEKNRKKISAVLWILLIAAILFWILSGYQFVQIVRAYRHELFGNPAQNVDEANFHLPGRTATPGEIIPADIQPWMTFNYLNFEFSLSSTTLKQALDVTDLRYPYLSINRLASEKHKSATSTTLAVQSTVMAVLQARQSQ